MSEVNLVVAFISGIASFFAPCFLALVPAFLAHLSGTSLTEVQERKTSFSWPIFSNTILFVFGFTTVFVILGASIGAVSTFFRDFSDILTKVGGMIIILFGLNILGIIKLPFFHGQFKTGVEEDKKGMVKLFSSFLVGSSFAIGWSACVGSVLAAILVLAGTSGSVVSGTFLLFVYSLGLMIPFLITGLATGWAQSFIGKHAKVLRYINWVGGVVLVIFGIFVFTGTVAKFIGRFSGFLPIRF